MSKSVFFIGIATVAVALAFVLTDSVVTTLTAGVTEANARRIRIGMIEPQVERILGGVGRKSSGWGVSGPEESGPEEQYGRLWASKDVQVWVLFDRSGCVECVCFWTRQGEAFSLSANQTWGPMMSFPGGGSPLPFPDGDPP
jgi:hypothetical protein